MDVLSSWHNISAPEKGIKKIKKKINPFNYRVSVALRKLGFRTIHILEMKFTSSAEEWIRAEMLFKMSWVEKNVKNRTFLDWLL